MGATQTIVAATIVAVVVALLAAVAAIDKRFIPFKPAQQKNTLS